MRMAPHHCVQEQAAKSSHSQMPPRGRKLQGAQVQQSRLPLPGPGLCNQCPRERPPALGPALPSVCMASSLCCTCCDIILLMPMRLSVMALDVWARLSLVVFLEVMKRRKRNVTQSLAASASHAQTRSCILQSKADEHTAFDDHGQRRQGGAKTAILESGRKNVNRGCFLKRTTMWIKPHVLRYAQDTIYK